MMNRELIHKFSDSCELFRSEAKAIDRAVNGRIRRWRDRVGDAAEPLGWVGSAVVSPSPTRSGHLQVAGH